MSFKVLFIYPNFRKMALIAPGPALLSSILKKNGFEVDMFDITGYNINEGKDYDRLTEETLGVRPSKHIEHKNSKRNPWVDLNDKIRLFRPNVIALSCTESTFLLGVEIIRHIKNRDPENMPVVLGGAFATYAPDRALDFPEIDIVCVGEGEKSFLELCERMEQKKPYQHTAGIAYRDATGVVRKTLQPEPVNLDDNPALDMELFDKDRLVRPMAGKLYKTVPIETIRGCPYHCDFCNSRYSGVRKKSISKIYEELLYYRNNYDIEYNFFWADTFLMMSKKELDEFCEMYKEINLPFWIQTRVETVTYDRIKKLKDVGLHRISIGIENGNEKFRREVMKKKFSNKRAIEAAEIIAKAGVPYNTNNMVGYPGETREIAMDTVRLNRLMKDVDNTNCFTFTPYYGTPSRVIAVERGFMDKDAIAPGNADDSILSMPEFPPEEIRGFRKAFALYVKFPESRWSEIKKAEEETPEGMEIFNRLQAEYKEKFFSEPQISF